MSEATSDSDVLVQLAEEFAERYRRGERPALNEYADKHPVLAERIRDLFPAMVAMEEAGARNEGAPNSEKDAKHAWVDGEGAAAPRRLGEFRLLREVARGGMGIVYEAVQEPLGRHVALKVLPFQGVRDTHLLERFRREARAAARLHHTNIVPVFGIGEHDGVHYYAMQFIDGTGLDAVIRARQRLPSVPQADAMPSTPPDCVAVDRAAEVAEGMLTGRYAPTIAGTDADAGPAQPPSTASSATDVPTPLGSKSGLFHGVARIGAQAADALAYAHQHGLLHRDIKPANLLLDRQGTVWIADFGLVKKEGDVELTTPGDVVGTLRYMAPERFNSVADPRSDLYSLGLTLYELVALRPAFIEPDRKRLIKQIMHDEPPTLRALDRRVPRDLETIIHKAMAKEPERRYQDATALAEDLRCFLSDRPIRARRTTVWKRSWRWCRRNPLAAGLLGMVVVLVLGSAVGGGVLNWQLWQALEQAETDRDKAVRAEEQKTEKLWQSLYERARAGRFSRQIGQRLDSLAALTEAARIRVDPKLRDEAIFAMTLPDVAPGQSWPSNSPKAPQRDMPGVPWSFASDYRTYFRMDDKGLGFREVTNDWEVSRLRDASPSRFKFSADGQFFACHDNALRVFRVNDGKKMLDVNIPLSNADQYDISPDNKLLAAALPLKPGSIELPIVCFDLTSGREVDRWTLAKGRGPIRFGPDSRRLAVATLNFVVVCNASNGKRLDRLPGIASALTTLAWHPDGVRLAISRATSPASIDIWNVVEGSKLLSLEQHVDPVTQMSFHSDGQLLATASMDGEFRLWHAYTGRLLLEAQQPIEPRFSPDGRWLGVVQQRGQIQLLETATSAEYRTLVGRRPDEKGYPCIGGISRNSRFAAVGFGGKANLWDLTTGREVAALPDSIDIWFGDDEDVFCNGAGIERVLLRKTDGRGNVALGPAETVLADKFYRPCVAGGGTLIVSKQSSSTPTATELQIYDCRTKAVLGELPTRSRTQRLAWSRDGRWLARAGIDGQARELEVWDMRSRQRVQRVPLNSNGAVFFSPDSKMLAVATEEDFTFWEVAAWKVLRTAPRQHRTFPGHVAFSPDSRWLAFEPTPGVIHLQTVADGKTVARLEDPHRDRAGWLGFTPDGKRLVVAAPYAGAIHIWDLHGIRARLKEMGLDWN